MATSAKLSILIPIYNVEQYLAQCLRSVCSQTLEDLEIICINDGSTDSSLSIIRDFMKEDPRIILIDKPNSGYGDSMNQSLQKATGSYIGIIEPDDWIEPDGFAKLYHAAEHAHADVVKSNYYRCFDRHGAEQCLPVTEISAELAASCPTTAAKTPSLFKLAPAIWSAIYRRDFLLRNEINFLPTPGASYQDLSFSFKVWALARRIVLLPDAFVHYRIDNTSSSVNSAAKINCVVDEYAEIETFLCERGIFSDFGAIMEATKFRNYHWNLQRLSSRPAKTFYKTYRDEFLAAESDGLLRRSDFSPKDWTALRAILHHPRLAFFVLRLRSFFSRRRPH